MGQSSILHTATDLDALKSIFQRHDVKLAYLFGSQVEGITHAHSDVDIAVLFSYDLEAKERFHRQLRLTGELMSFFHRNDVDVAPLNDATALLAYEIVKYGRGSQRIIFVRDESVGGNVSLPRLARGYHEAGSGAETP